MFSAEFSVTDSSPGGTTEMNTDNLNLTTDTTTLTCRNQFAKDLRHLYDAADRPSLRMLAALAHTKTDTTTPRHKPAISAQRISDWKAGKNLPANFDSLQPVLLVLIHRTRRRGTPIPPRLTDLKTWRRTWTIATTRTNHTRNRTRKNNPTPLDNTPTADLTSLMVRGQTAINAALWAATNRTPQHLYNTTQLQTALQYIDINHPHPTTNNPDLLIIDFLRASAEHHRPADAIGCAS